jgi:dehydrogenase/reductase SDR family protein 7B
LPPSSFNGKVCWITGASSGIGESMAKALSGQGASLILSSRTEDKLIKVKNECAHPSAVAILPCDMEDTSSLPDVAQSAWNTFQKLDYVFLNAGMAVRDTVVNTETRILLKIMNANFLGAATIARSLLPLMIQRGSGTFVVTSSLSGKYGIPKLSAYAASKHALHGFFSSLRAEYAREGIKVSMVIPGLIKTGISIHALTGEGKPYGKMMESLATGMSPDECAEKILKGVWKGKNEVIVGKSEKLSLLLNRLFPSLMAWIIRNHPLEKLRKFGLVRRK